MHRKGIFYKLLQMRIVLYIFTTHHSHHKGQPEKLIQTRTF